MISPALFGRRRGRGCRGSGRSPGSCGRGHTFRIDSFLVDVFLVLKFENDRRLDSIPVCVERNSSSDAHEAFGGVDGILELWSLSGAGASDGIGQDFHRVIAERRERVRDVAVAGFVGSYKLLNFR